jgi:hypothetical protein
MQDLIADEQRTVRRGRHRLIAMFATCVTAAGATVLAAPEVLATPLELTMAAAFLSVGQFVAGEALAPGPDRSSPAGLLINARKGLGWRD